MMHPNDGSDGNVVLAMQAHDIEMTRLDTQLEAFVKGG